MPAARLPWIKFWPELVDHPKFAELNDSERWTWIEVWAKASQQSNRWHFASLSHAVKVTGRPAKQIRKLVQVGLIDESSDGIYIHNAAKWQDRFPSDYSDGVTPNIPRKVRGDKSNAPSTLPEDSANGLPKTPRKLREDSVNTAVKAAANPALEEEEELTPLGSPPFASARGRNAEVIDAIRELGIKPTLAARDHSAIKATSADPTDIAEVYGAVYRGEYGDDFMRKRLSVHEAIGWIDGYRASKLLKETAGRNGHATVSRRMVDHTGCEAGCPSLHPEQFA